MTVSIYSLYSYLKRNPRYWFSFMYDLGQVYWSKIQRKRIVVITTESEGLGGYLWIRSYYKITKDYFQHKKGCTIILIGMANWKEFVETIDLPNQLDIFRPFESCDSHKFIERLFFRLFKADYYIDFRTIYLENIVQAKHKILGKGFMANSCFYEEANNATFMQFLPLPDSFKHTLPIHTFEAEWLDKSFVVLVEGGFTQGKLSDKQLSAIALNLLQRNYSIFFNGDISRIISLLPESTHQYIIDGYKYPIHQYGHIVNECQFVVTPNSLLYHYAVQLDKPCVVLSANEYLTLDLKKKNQIIVYNPELQALMDQGCPQTYIMDPQYRINQFDTNRIISAINQLIILIEKKWILK